MLVNIPTLASTHIFAVMVALPAEAMRRKAIIRAGKNVINSTERYVAFAPKVCQNQTFV
jgi:hypothetical protein